MTDRAYGCLEKTPDVRDYTFQAPRPYTGAFVDLSGLFPQKPYNQLNLGSCVSQGTAAVVDFVRAKQGLPPLGPPSRLFIYYQGRLRAGYPLNQDTGLQIRDGFIVIAKDGAPPESDWAYDVARFAEKPAARAYTDGQADQAVKFGAVAKADIDATIASGYPVAFGFTVRESFESDTTAATGVMPAPAAGEKALGGHCVVAVSTPKDGADIPGGVPGVKYRKCRNSWGHDGTWGAPDDPGHFWMPVAVMDGSESSDFWVVTLMEDPHAPTPPQPGPPPLPGPSPQPVPGALEAAVRGMVDDALTTTVLARRHIGAVNEAIAKHVGAIVKAAGGRP